MNIEELFEERKNNPLLNTSYPLSPNDWKEYLKNEPLIFEEGDICFYIHIPFCKKICSFCEYSKVILPEEDVQRRYLEVLGKDILSFLETHKNIRLRGFDIGGGTPTSLSNQNFDLLLNVFDKVLSRVEIAEDFEPSIEATFDTINQYKIDRIAKSKIRRISLGLQSTCDDVLLENNRDNISFLEIQKVMTDLYSSGVKKINLDFMYGIKAQSLESIKNDLKVIKQLKPEQLTVYELRTNMINIKPYKTSNELFEEYSLIFKELSNSGYIANFGQNTFSLDSSDFGVSSYLRNRMLKGIQYKGFGISAQSMSVYGVSYNKGKRLCEIRSSLSDETFEENKAYYLPKREVLSKFIAISGYSGSLDMKAASKITPVQLTK
ncbi:MAG: radical SAM protein [Spirochaetales bacterium]|nr:radical SAM protein [Spirochaetia bacterium]MDD7460440.1 radical SAM protein [Spirochaetales bacterium]MDD7611835.1 radical SAM protein [Spirochaetales bacterium]MDY5914095.1 radical SAM protein [Treponema sp.]